LFDINRYSKVPVRLNDPSLKYLPVTAVFGIDQIEIMINGLAQILPVKIEKDNKGYFINRLVGDKDINNNKIM